MLYIIRINERLIFINHLKVMVSARIKLAKGCGRILGSYNTTFILL